MYEDSAAAWYCCDSGVPSATNNLINLSDMFGRQEANLVCSGAFSSKRIYRDCQDQAR